MSALQIDLLFTIGACLGELLALSGAALLLGVPQRAYAPPPWPPSPSCAAPTG
jgi:hypothetical protein